MSGGTSAVHVTSPSTELGQRRLLERDVHSFMNAEGCSSVSAKVGRPSERFCKRGHDTEQAGRRSHGWCTACARERQRQTRGIQQNYRDMIRLGGVTPSRLRKLVTKDDATTAWFAYRRCSWGSATAAALRLWKTDRISVESADEWCVALGTHLAIVYPEVYYQPTRREDTVLI